LHCHDSIGFLVSNTENISKNNRLRKIPDSPVVVNDNGEKNSRWPYNERLNAARLCMTQSGFRHAGKPLTSKSITDQWNRVDTFLPVTRVAALRATAVAQAGGYAIICGVSWKLAFWTGV
jgi:hypothetical protein